MVKSTAFADGSVRLRVLLEPQERVVVAVDEADKAFEMMVIRPAQRSPLWRPSPP